jgi:hypothetical protein
MIMLFHFDLNELFLKSHGGNRGPQRGHFSSAQLTKHKHSVNNEHINPQVHY